MADIKKSILHVEDDGDFHMYVDALLEDIANVVSVYSVRDAMALLAGSKFDLFILDLVLKDGSGSGLAKKLNESFPGTPVVILSAHNITDAIVEADASFVKSSFDEDNFIDTVKGLLFN